MSLNYSLVLLLLLGLSASEPSPCKLSRDLTRCVCDTIVFHDPQSLDCSFATELELRDGKVDFNPSLFDIGFIFKLILINKVIFNNATIPSSLISATMPYLKLSSLRKISIVSSTVEDVPPVTFPAMTQSNFRDVQLDDVTVDASLLQPSHSSFHLWLFGSLTSLSLVRFGLARIDCDSAKRVEALQHLDLSGNPLSDTSLQDLAHCASLSFTSLTSLRLGHSQLSSLQSLCPGLSLAPALTTLDVSRNNFSTIHFPHCLQVKPLKMLNLSHSGITEVISLLSASLEELDLSYNSLEVFSGSLQGLKKLDLSHNRLKRLPSLDGLPVLMEMRVDSNQLTVLVKGAGVDLEQLHSLYAGNNPYRCDCTLEDTTAFLGSKAGLSVEDPEDFLCAAPVAQQGAQIMNVTLAPCASSSSDIHEASFLFVSLLSCLIYFC